MKRVYVRHYHKVSQNPKQDTDLRTYAGAWTLDAVWSWLCRSGIVAGTKSKGANPRQEEDVFVYFLDGTYHSVVVGPLDGPSAAKHNGKTERG